MSTTLLSLSFLLSFRRSCLLSLIALGLPAGAAEVEAPSGRFPLTLVALVSQNHAGRRWIQGRHDVYEIPLAIADGKLRLAQHAGHWLLDRNGDGRFDDGDLPAIEEGGAFTVPVTVAGTHRQLTLHLGQLFPNDDRLVIEGSPALVATVGPQRLWLVDRDLDGVFDQSGTDGTLVAPIDAQPDPASILPRGRVVAVGGALVEASVIDRGAALELKAWNGPVATATLSLAGAGGAAPRPVSAQITLRQRDGLMSATVSTARATTLAAGDYQVLEEHISIILSAEADTTEQGAGRLITLRGEGPYPPVGISAGENRLVRGLPDRLLAEMASPSPGLVVVGAVVLADAHGGCWRAEANSGSKSTLSCLLRSDGREQPLGTMEYG